MQTKETIQILSAEGSIHNLSFSSDRSYLKTECGLFELSCPHRSVGQSHSNFSSYLYIKKQWVVCRTENILWLPADYRPICLAVRDNILAMGHASGRVTFIEFDLAKMPLGVASSTHIQEVDSDAIEAKLIDNTVSDA